MKTREKSIFGLRLKTIGLSMITFVLCYILLQVLFRFPAVHGIYETLELFVYYQLFTSTSQPNENIVILDEENKVYNRADYANLISGLSKQRAKVIAFDVVFAGDKDPAGDAKLVAATRAASVRIIHAVELMQSNENPILPERFQIKRLKDMPPDRSVEGATGVLLPFQALLDVTQNLGCTNSSWDIVHRDEQYFPMIVQYYDQVIPCMPLLSVMKFLNIPVNELKFIDDETLGFKSKTKEIKIPVDYRSQILVNFINPERFHSKRISIEEAFKKISARKPFFKNKIVIIGNSFDSQEQTHGPHFERYPNIIVYASIISQILNDQNISEGILESLFISIFMVMLGVSWSMFFSQRYPRIKGWLVYIFFGLLLGLAMFVFLGSGLRIYVVLPYALFALTYAVANSYHRRRINRFKVSSKTRKLSEKMVFISYSHRDTAFAKKLRTALEKNGVKVTIDIEKLRAGDKIEDFIDDAVQDSDFTISIVSKHSLKSAWVIVESLEMLIHEKVRRKKKFIPVFIDKSFLQDSFQSELIEGVEQSLTTLNTEIRKLTKKFLLTTNLESKRTKLIELRNNIDKILARLNQSLTLDFSTPAKFNKNLPQLVSMINDGRKK